MSQSSPAPKPVRSALARRVEIYALALSPPAPNAYGITSQEAAGYLAAHLDRDEESRVQRVLHSVGAGSL